MTSVIERLEDWLEGQSFSTKHRLELYHKFESYLADGIPVDQILSTLARSYKKSKSRRSVGLILTKWNEDLEAGSSLSEIIGKWAPSGEAMMIKAGEESGDLIGAFKNVIKATEAEQKMKSTIYKAMGYPSALLIMMAGLMFIFAVFSMPPMVEVLDPELWPSMAKSLYNVSQFIQFQGIYVVILIGALVFAIVRSLPKAPGEYRDMLDNFPPWSLYKTYQSSVFLISLSGMLNAGKDMESAIKEMRELSSPYVSFHLRNMLISLNVGRDAGEAINGKFIDEETGMDIEMYGALSDIEKSLYRIGDNAIENTIQKIQRNAAIAQNAVIIMLASYMAWVYIAFYTLTTAIGDSAVAG